MKYPEEVKSDADERALSRGGCKVCTKCGAVYVDIPLNFNKLSKSNDGYSPWCKECAKEYDRAYRAKNKDRINKNKRKRRRNNPELFRESDRLYRERNRDAINKRRRENRAQNPDRYNEYNRLWRKKNIDRHKKTLKKWRDANREKLRELDKERYWQDPQKARERKKLTRNKEKARVAHKRWLHSNPKNRICDSMSSAVYRVLKGQKRGHPWVDMVGYSAKKTNGPSRKTI
jgi:hypothetical protein